MEQARLRTCRHCGDDYTPDPYNAWHQQFCTKPECRAASKAASQAKWLAKNPGYFTGEDNVRRVQTWRFSHPGYSRRCRRRRRRSNNASALQELALGQHAPFEGVAGTAEAIIGDPARLAALLENPPVCGVHMALQDLAYSQHAVVAALVTRDTGGALQDVIGDHLRGVYGSSRRILARRPVRPPRPTRTEQSRPCPAAKHTKPCPCHPCVPLSCSNG